MYVDPELLRRVDNAIRFDLESWRLMFFHWLIGSAILVAVGVGLEGPELFHEVRNIWRSPKSDARDWIKLIGLAGWIFVIVGVFGEGIFEGAFSISDGQLQTFDEILLNAAQREAVDAATSARNATDDALQAKGDAKGANLNALSAETSAGNAAADEKQLRADLVAATTALSDSQKEFENEQAEIEESQLIVNDFELHSPGVRSLRLDLATRLKLVAPERVNIQYVNKAEPRLLAYTLALSLRRAGWNKIDEPRPTGDGPDVPKGVTIYNKWTSFPVGTVASRTPDGRIEFEPMKDSMKKLASLGVPDDEVIRLAYLSVALDGTLVNRSDIDGLIIVIGNSK